ncbi:MAG TPA: M20 family metallo-hydrolase [Cyclobacteriaceae bacterium]|nr:M20 family metallo-hydrolase [Cyclobacteriaceae bacterium]HMV08718.1 M20 family metallo-hydrolase [Cyclobacteriaceae bacterium]HMV90054.1 M20 family metallo-hydrolase [Cyclobacteriaceae bacterium]HMW99863.1 M20 family metallo-hydrolase [Cyclobacteriaceae bacterium]HMX49274.1 M20 family metallo-hydrolase [Cyclobacteriaceae bacterium]
MTDTIKTLKQEAIELLQQLVGIPSFSKEEDKTATLIADFLSAKGIPVNRSGNNIWAVNKHFDGNKPSLLLNSHHDTVKPNPGYTRDPFKAEILEGKLYGLGSNDAGGPLVSLIAAFVYFYDVPGLPYNIVLAATAEEEISGTGGIERIWNDLPKIDCAIVGEPTMCEAAVAEKGLMVLDCVAKGRAGHAAREEGLNAIYQALEDIEWFRGYEFPKVSQTLGRVKMSVTVINAGQAHNQVPAECKFTVDVRVTDSYTLEEVLDVVRHNVICEVTPRSLRLRPSGIDKSHPLLKAVNQMQVRQYGSPTTSDQALIPVPSIKMGPGDSARSHSADEFIYVDEIRKGIDLYIQLIRNL